MDVFAFDLAVPKVWAVAAPTLPDLCHRIAAVAGLALDEKTARVDLNDIIRGNHSAPLHPR